MGVVDSRPAQGRPAPLLVGREREIGILRDHLAAAMGGAGSLVLISGVAGIGKTALVEALYRSDGGVLFIPMQPQRSHRVIKEAAC